MGYGATRPLAGLARPPCIPGCCTSSWARGLAGSLTPSRFPFGRPRGHSAALFQLRLGTLPDGVSARLPVSLTSLMVLHFPGRSLI